MIPCMQQEFRWSDTRDVDGYRLPGPDHLGRWATAAMLVSVLLHVLVFFALDHVKIAFGMERAEDIVTGPIDVRQVEVRPYEPERALPPEETVTPPTESAALLEQVDLLDLLPEDEEIDISPGVAESEYALKMSNPLAEGELDAPDMELSSNLDLEASLPDFGRMESDLNPAAVGQITVDPGAVQVDDGALTDFTDELIKRGNQGLVENGTLDGIESLDELLDLPANLLLSAKTLLPSDLIFEFNRAELRESAKVGLFKLALLIDKNPNLYCWIEGHSDLIGGDEFNLRLSKQRADAVKDYLVKSLQIDPDRIITRGYGRSRPIVITGDAEAQGPNRRVEIKMRKTPPTDEPLKITPKARPVEEAPPQTREMPPAREIPATREVPPSREVPELRELPAPPKAQPAVTSEEPAPPEARTAVMPEEPAPPKARPAVMPEEPTPPKAVLVKPNIKPRPVEQPKPPKAVVIPETPSILKAQPVEEPSGVPRALPVEP